MKQLEKNWLEWSVFAVALVLVLATFGYLIFEAVTTDDTPPDVLVTLGPPRPGSGGFMVPVEATNRGGRPAEDLRIAVRLERAGDATEESVLLFPYLPRESTRQGWVTFRTDPRSGTLRVSGVGFQSP